jgi:hypothetical protein
MMNCSNGGRKILIMAYFNILSNYFPAGILETTINISQFIRSGVDFRNRDRN